MSSFDRRSALALLVLTLAGSCGISPAGRTRGLPIGRIAVEVPGGRKAFTLESQLEERLGRDESAVDYQLFVTLETSERRSGASGSGGIDRFAADGVAEFELIDVQSGHSLYQDKVSASASWSATDHIVSSLSAHRDAEDRMINQIADRIVTRLMISSESWLR